MIVPHPTVERFNAEILADLLQDAARDYLKTLTTTDRSERARSCPADVLFQIRQMTRLFGSMSGVPWTYGLLREWMGAWSEAEPPVSGWFVGAIDVTDAKRRIAALGANLRELVTGEKETVDFENFPLLPYTPTYYKGKGMDILKGEMG